MDDENIRNDFIIQERNAIRKTLSEKNKMDKLKTAFENENKSNDVYKMTMEEILKQFDDGEFKPHEDVFRNVGGEEFAANTKGKDLDTIMKTLAQLVAGRLSEDEKKKYLEIFNEIYRQ